MSDTVIEIDNLWKKYRLGALGTGTLRHDFNRWWHRVRGKPDPYAIVGQVQKSEVRSQKSEVTFDPSLADDEMWALRGVSLEVKQGEIVGIIGRNGAGKSTLLKILSRVTAPTSGEVRVRGRIASLLEVGTGFHPELTGRENIFLNGAILGMTKGDIQKNLDEIIAFAEVEKFIDTPVKRYSSGMYVRLAFAVAAHLDADILIVDEVLAVGDMAFQRKCLSKMQGVGAQGRTVLFVSHNLAAIKTLCGRALWLTNGNTAMDGPATEIVVATYIASVGSRAEVKLEERIDRQGNGRFQFTRVQFASTQGWEVDQITSGDELKIRLDYRTKDWVDEKRMIIIVSFREDEDRPVVTFCSDEMGAAFAPFQPTGTVELSIPNFLIRAGNYKVSLFARNGTELDEDLYDRIYLAASLDVVAGDVWKSGRTNRPGPCAFIPASLHN